MSTEIVNRRIEELWHKPVVGVDDIDWVLSAALKSERGKVDGVSNAEARSIADLYVRIHAGPRAPSSNGSGARRHAPVLDDNARLRLNQFFEAHHLPYGENKQRMRTRIERALDGRSLDAPMRKEPRIGSLQPLRLSSERAAYVDVVKRCFVLRAGDAFFGPFPIE